MISPQMAKPSANCEQRLLAKSGSRHHRRNHSSRRSFTGRTRDQRRQPVKPFNGSRVTHQIRKSSTLLSLKDTSRPSFSRRSNLARDFLHGNVRKQSLGRDGRTARPSDMLMSRIDRTKCIAELSARERAETLHSPANSPKRPWSFACSFLTSWREFERNGAGKLRSRLRGISN
jgi:hypothetical protein